MPGQVTANGATGAFSSSHLVCDFEGRTPDYGWFFEGDEQHSKVCRQRDSARCRHSAYQDFSGVMIGINLCSARAWARRIIFFSLLSARRDECHVFALQPPAKTISTSPSQD
jgi:hypothetical protein